jgi:hypothetical protein
MTNVTENLDLGGKKVITKCKLTGKNKSYGLL